MKKSEFNIVFCVDNIYSVYLTVTVNSIIKNNNDIRIIIHVISNYISDTNLRRLFDVINKSKNVELRIHLIDDNILEPLKTTKNWTIQTWYRILIPDILGIDVHTALYLDADTIITGSLKELLLIDLTDKAVAGVPEANYFNEEYYKRLNYEIEKGYICAGTLLMNLDFWRKNSLTKKMIEWAKRNYSILKMLDQDAINYFCRDTKLILSLKYGVVQWFFINENFYQGSFLSQLREALESPIIIHYAFCNPWEKDSQRHIMFNEWEKYNRNLRNPVKRKYRSRGLLKIKIILWNIIHRKESNHYLTKMEVLRRIINHQ